MPTTTRERVGTAAWRELEAMITTLFGDGARHVAAGPVAVIGAHPDDETIGASWLLARAPSLSIIQVTDGAPHDRRLWPSDAPRTRTDYAALRRTECEAALAEVGVSPRQIMNLWFADQDAARSLVEVARSLATVLARIVPTLVVTHPYEGGHPDHDATSFAVRAALALGVRDGLPRPRVLEMTSYHRREGALETGRFLPHDQVEVTCVLDPDERARKRRMFDAYASQRAVLSDFRIDEERYRVAARVPFDRPPHEGPLHAEVLGFAVSGAAFRDRVDEARRVLGLGPDALDVQPT